MINTSRLSYEQNTHILNQRFRKLQNQTPISTELADFDRYFDRKWSVGKTLVEMLL